MQQTTEQTITVFYFTADWCGPCKVYGPRVRRWAQETPGVSLVEMNADKSHTLVTEMGVRSLPTTIFMAPDGSVSSFLVGSKSEQQLDAALSLAREA